MTSPAACRRCSTTVLGCAMADHFGCRLQVADVSMKSQPQSLPAGTSSSPGRPPTLGA